MIGEIMNGAKAGERMEFELLVGQQNLPKPGERQDNLIVTNSLRIEQFL